MIDNITSFPYVVVTFRSKISAFRSLVRFITSRSLALYSSELISSLYLRLSRSLSAIASSNTLLLSPCFLSDVPSGSSEHGLAKGSAHLTQGFVAYVSTSTQLLISCCCSGCHIPLLPISDEPFFFSTQLLEGGP